MPDPLVIFGGIASLLCLLYLGYRRALPRPIPGIPYNQGATKSLLGDAVAMAKSAGKTDEIWAWVKDNQANLPGPIMQLFVKPFSKPWVIIYDFKETQDICLRRTREFDRTPFIGEIFGGIAKEHHFLKPTNDAWKQHRRLIQDLMLPAFLNNVAAPSIYNTFLELLQFWESKAEIANGRPFKADRDVYLAAFDVVWSSMFNLDPSAGALRAQMQASSCLEKSRSPKDEEFEFPEATCSDAVEAILTLAHSVGTCSKTPMPALVHWFLCLKPSMRNAKAVKEKFFKDQINQTLKRFEGAAEKDREVRCALDGILTKEMSMAEKDGRQPEFHSRAMYDEILGFVIAAHDTTSTTVNWGLKFLADNQHVQTKLRTSLRNSLPEAFKENRLPNVQEILKNSDSYLDAVIEEILRCGITAPATSRVATTDVEVLGRKISKGTYFMLMANGASVMEPAYKIDESLRSLTYHSTKNRIGTWDPENVSQFIPERWLAMEDGKEVFDSHAGPFFGFGLGPRGCYGKKLAYLQLKMQFTMILWTFELQKCPEALSSYAAEDVITHMPKQCYVRLKKIE